MKRFTAPRPLTSADLQQLAITYVSRYATTRQKLAAYLQRKLKERGWEGSADPSIDNIVARMAEQGFVDDRAYAEMKAGSLSRRGYGVRRVRQALMQAGVDESDAAVAARLSEEDADAAALAFAKRRRLGPFSSIPDDSIRRRKALAAMLRAGHEYLTARRILDLSPELVQDGRALSGQ